MVKFTARRLLFGVVAVVAIVAVNFLLTRLAPGDPVRGLVGDYPAPPEYLESLRERFGLDESVWVQLRLYLQALFSGDFGYSFANRADVLPLILDRAGSTLLIMVPAVVIASSIGLILGIVAATRAGRGTDVAISTSVLITDSVPVFWLGQMVLLVFAVQLGALPTQGMNSAYGGGPFDTLEHAILPIATLTIVFMTSITRVTRVAVIEALRQDYIVTARSKGVSKRRVLFRHALRNSWVPVITVLGGEFAFIITGAILTETVFGWPGAGALFVEAINSRDYPVVQGIFVFSAVSVVVANLIADLLYAVVDPRIRKGYVGA